MKIVSYFTKDTPYEDEINEKLIPSLEKFKLDYCIEGIEDLGDWYNNTGYKAEFIKKMLIKNKEPVVFLDADAIIVKYPELLYNIPEHTDLGFLHFNWSGHWRGDWSKDHEKIELLSGTMFWGYNEKVISLIDEWILQNKQNVHQWEQKTLEKIVFSRNDLKIFNLPYEYCCVLMQDNSIPKYIKDPVIIHTQASRKYKRRTESWRLYGK